MRGNCKSVAFAIIKIGQNSLTGNELVLVPANRRIVLVKERKSSSSLSFVTLVSTADAINDVVVTSETSGPSLDIQSIFANDILSTQDIVNGAILACALAIGYSYLNGQSSTSSFVSWPNQKQYDDDDSLFIDPSVQGNDNKIFNADDWREMSKKENYILYSTKIRRQFSGIKSVGNDIDKRENKMTLVALLLLFVPIFSVEFFFALSRQFMCDMGNESVAIRLCSSVSKMDMDL
jgi:hypothetical protein